MFFFCLSYRLIACANEPPSPQDPFLGAVLGRPTTTGNYFAETEVDLSTLREGTQVRDAHVGHRWHDRRKGGSTWQSHAVYG
jgi:hypothetical protein